MRPDRPTEETVCPTSGIPSVRERAVTSLQHNWASRALLWLLSIPEEEVIAIANAIGTAIVSETEIETETVTMLRFCRELVANLCKKITQHAPLTQERGAHRFAIPQRKEKEKNKREKEQ